ncbi:MAG: hypothetical protein KF894_14090 [Labilithrix sp.]|nr:hypothetical protein [Labilithrix sp.]
MTETSTRRTRAAFVIAGVVAAVLVGGCDDGADANGDGSGAPSCARACATVDRCEQELGRAFDTASCEQQCPEELAGRGHLHPQVADGLFRILAAPPDERCEVLDARFRGGWGFNIIYARGYIGMPGRDENRRCAEKQVEVCESSASLQGESCFVRIYARPETVWASAAPCFDKSYEGEVSTCGAYFACLTEAIGPASRAQPWLGASLAEQ